MNSHTKYRKYQKIWERLKLAHSICVLIEKDEHSKIIKAVIKEKYLDAEYRESLSSKSQKAIIRTDTGNATIQFKLEIYTGGYKV